MLAIISYGCFAQNNGLLVRHDTTLLRANECEWIVRSLVKNDPSLTGADYLRDFQLASDQHVQAQTISAKEYMKRLDEAVGEKEYATSFHEYAANNFSKYMANGGKSASPVIRGFWKKMEVMLKESI